METRNTETGEVARYMETYQDWAAELLCEGANKSHAATGRPLESYVIKLPRSGTT